MTNTSGLSFNTRKALAVHVGEAAANEISTLLLKMSAQIEELKKGKVSVTPVIPGQASKDRSPIQAIDNETF